MSSWRLDGIRYKRRPKPIPFQQNIADGSKAVVIQAEPGQPDEDWYRAMPVRNFVLCPRFRINGLS